jgi:hypothetical protein
MRADSADPYRAQMVVSAAVRLGWSGRRRRPALEEGDPSVHHHPFRHKTRQSKPEDEDRPDRKRPTSGESRRLPAHVAPIGVAAERPPGPASEWPWRLLPPTSANAPVRRAAEDADDESPPPDEQDESEEPTLLPAA